MKVKILPAVLVASAGLVIIGSIAYVVHNGQKSRARVSLLRRETAQNAQALTKALAEARSLVREDLRKQAAETDKADPDAAKKRVEMTQRRRRAIQRSFFGNKTLQLSRSYLKACEMPAEDPTAEDQEIIDLAGEMMSEEDLDTAADVTEAALKSADPRARMAAVEMLSALGKAGLTDIGEFLADEHPEVANLAAERWELGIQEIEDDAERTALAKVGLLAITDEDHLTSMVGTLMLASDELLVIQTVADVMRDGNKAQRKAVNEAYSFLTGDQWTGEEAAEKWLQENYEPPEPDAGGDEPDESEDEGTDDESAN